MAGGGIKQINNTIRGGADGATYIPHIDEDGQLTWTVTKGGYSVPKPINIKGKDGIDGEKGETGAKLVSQILEGQDANGGNIYLQTFDDGTVARFVAPKGPQGNSANINLQNGEGAGSIVQKQGGAKSSSGEAETQSTAKGINATSLGSGNEANGDNDFSAGRKNKNYQSSSSTLGGGCVAGDEDKQRQFLEYLESVGGDYSKLTEEQRKIYYSFALAEGERTIAKGKASHSQNGFTQALGDYSHAGGLGTIANKQAQTVIGRYNEDSDALFVVGNGASDEHRRNAFEVFEDGHAEMQRQGYSDKSIVGMNLHRIDMSRVDDLYSILLQKGEIVVKSVEDTYTSRKTANGELNIADGVNTEVLSIKGDTIKSNNLCKSFESGTLDTTNGQPVANPARLRTTPIKIKANTVYYLSFDTSQVMLANGCLYYEDGRFHSFDRYPSSTNHDGVISFPIDGYYVIIFRKPDGSNIEDLTIGNIQFEEGSTKTPYTPYFEGLKNANFKSITSCGKNLFSIELFRRNEFELDTVSGYYRSKKPIYPVGDYKWTADKFNSTVDKISVVLLDKDNNAKAFLVNNGTLVDNATITSTQPLYLGVNYYISGFLDSCTLDGQLEIGTATEYEPYKEDTISLSNEVELQKFDTAYPKENKIVRGSKTIVLNGTESWRYSTDLNKIDLLIETYALNTQANEGICNRLEYTLNETKKGIHAYGGHLYLTQALSNTYTSIADWKSQLSAWANEGNPLTITYTVQTPTEEQATFNKSYYKAWKGGREVVNEGITDNSEYGAKATITQDYYVIIGEEV